MAGTPAGRNEIPVDRNFFARPTLEVAPQLIGMILHVRAAGEPPVAGRIVEVEAYLGRDDPASHAAGGQTPRAAIMYGPPGLAYVYLIYGVHHCLNFVTEDEGTAGAVLVRALQPVSGREIMAVRRGLEAERCTDRQLTAGPGKLCQACGIDRSWNGQPLLAGSGKGHGPDPRGLWLTRGQDPAAITIARRIGIRKARDLPYRFLENGNPCLSRI